VTPAPRSGAAVERGAAERRFGWKSARERVSSGPVGRKTAEPTTRSDHEPSPGDTLSVRLERETGVKSSICYQCGKCTAGCPLGEEMDHAPSELLRMLQLELPEHERRVLSAGAIWMCIGCETCISRCPKEVDLPRAMDFLRRESLEQDCVHPGARDIVAFHRAFLGSIERHGRLFELGTVLGYKLRTGHLAQDAALAPAMMRKGKLGLFPHRGDARAVAGIFERSRAPQKERKE